MAWSIVSQDPESGLYMWSDGSSTKWGGLDGTYWDESGNRQNIRALEPTPAGWSVTNSVDNGEAGYTAPTFTNGSLSLAYNPATGPASRILALEALYSPYINSNTAKMNEIIAASPDAYAGFGITPQNAGQLVESTFYDRIHNIDKNDWIDTIGQGALGALYGAAIGDFTGLFSMDNAMGNLFGGQSGPVASGSAPTQVGGWQWSGDPRFAGTTVDGVLQPSGQNWWNTDWGTEWPVDLGTNASSNTINLKDLYNSLDEMQSYTNGVTAPSPTISIPGYGDVYGNAANILKNINNIPGLSSVLKGALSGDTGSQSLISKLLGGDGSASDWMKAIGSLVPSLLGAYASNQQTNALTDLAKKYQDFGAPYRQQLADITANPDNFYNSLGAQKATDSVLHKLSIGGNPSGSPYKQQLAVDSLWNEYGKERDRLAGFGGLTNYNAAAPSLDAQAVNSQGNMYNALGAGLNDIFNPKTSLADLLKQGKVV